MILTLVCYQLVPVGLVWLFLLLFWLGPTDSGVRGQTTAKLTQLRPNCPREPKPFTCKNRYSIRRTCQRNWRQVLRHSPVALLSHVWGQKGVK
jgi:hypothetical protein